MGFCVVYLFKKYMQVQIVFNLSDLTRFVACGVHTERLSCVNWSNRLESVDLNFFTNNVCVSFKIDFESGKPEIESTETRLVD